MGLIVGTKYVHMDTKTEKKTLLLIHTHTKKGKHRRKELISEAKRRDRERSGEASGVNILASCSCRTEEHMFQL